MRGGIVTPEAIFYLVCILPSYYSLRGRATLCPANWRGTVSLFPANFGQHFLYLEKEWMKLRFCDFTFSW